MIGVCDQKKERLKDAGRQKGNTGQIREMRKS
jgi:ribosomal protein L29